MKTILLFLLGSLLLLTGWSQAETVPADYLVGDGDILKISVYDNPDLDTVSRVGADGVIQFPLIGRVDVSGLSVSAVAKLLEQKLADGYLVNPQVAIFIQEYRSKKVVIMGQIRTPGVYELSGPTKLLELISMAGGLTEGAGDKLTINRKTASEQKEKQVVKIDLKRLLETGSPELNAKIMDGDNIFIPKAGMVYVIGEVNRPAGYKYEEGATVLKVISMAGDFAEFAAKGKVRIIRKIDGKEVVLEKVSLQEPVFAGDVIEVPESFF